MAIYMWQEFLTDDINSNENASIDVLNDAASAAIYRFSAKN